MKYRCPEFIKEVLDAFEGDERLVVTIGCGFVNALLCGTGFLTGGEYVMVTTATVAVYIGAKSVDNVAESRSRTMVAQADGQASEAASISRSSVAESQSK